MPDPVRDASRTLITRFAARLRFPQLFAFVASLGVTRPEYVFAAFLALTGLWLCPPDLRTLRRLFVLAFATLLAVGVAL